MKTATKTVTEYLVRNLESGKQDSFLVFDADIPLGVSVHFVDGRKGDWFIYDRK